MKTLDVSIEQWPYLARMKDEADSMGLITEYSTQSFFGQVSGWLYVTGLDAHRVSYKSWVNEKSNRINTGAHLWLAGEGVGRPMSLKQAKDMLNMWESELDDAP